MSQNQSKSSTCCRYSAFSLSQLMLRSNSIPLNPFANPPPFEKLVGDLAGALSRRINIQHRLVYEVISE
jgi:Txe/YoeB family toxin of toxin-antitoxin system